MSGVNTAAARANRRGRYAEELVGRVFGRLTVTGRNPVCGRRGEARWDCRCVCGASHVVLGRHLRSGDVSSCGCLYRETVATYRRTQGEAQREQIVAALAGGPLLSTDLASRLGLYSGTILRHATRLLADGRICRAAAGTHRGPRVVYALAQADADAHLAALAAAARAELQERRAAAAPPPPPEPAPAPVVVPPPPPSAPRLAPRMLPIVPRGDAHANAQARAWGVERRHDCDRYDACLDAVPTSAVDARCPRECPGYEVDPSETHEARMLAATARVKFDTASQYPITRGLGSNDNRK